MSTNSLSRVQAIELLTGLVSVPSLSTQEQAASAWLVDQMRALGFRRAYVDEVHNAVGEVGPADAARTLILLGHIDTVPGAIPVRVEGTGDDAVLYGRGTVDAKGPLATFVSAAARVGDAWAAAHDVRIIVVGAVEEEAATSRGARHIRARFDGAAEPIPDACIIGEPSSWERVTLGYKGRLLVELDARQPMAHTAGPDAGVATVAVDFWQWVADFAARFNADRTRTFDQLLPSLRRLQTGTDDALNDFVEAQVGVRLPLDFDVQAFVHALAAWTRDRVGATEPGAVPTIGDGASVQTIACTGAQIAARLRLRGFEPAWRSDRSNPLVRSFLGAIRAVDASQRPSFVVKTGTSDMNVVGPAWGCPIVAYGPGDSTLDHTPHEHVNLTEYWRAVLVLEQALRNLAA